MIVFFVKNNNKKEKEINNRFTLKTEGIFEFKDNNNPTQKRIGTVVGIISLICLLSNIFYRAEVKKDFCFFMRVNIIFA